MAPAHFLYLSIRLQAVLLYHISNCLSRGFFRFFQIFFLSHSTRFCDFSCPLPRSATPVRLGSELIYYTTFRIVCQEIFSKFLLMFFSIKLFSKHFRLFSFPKVACFPDLRASLSRPTALLLYHGFLKKSSRRNS